MRFKFSILINCMIVAIIFFGVGNVSAAKNFIRVDGVKLMDGEKEFRFLSFNVPTLNYVEDEMSFKNPNPYGLPSEFELRDLFKTVNALGGRVVRSYTIPVRNSKFPKEAVTYVEAPGVFNEKAFKVMDKVIALAGEYDIRVVVPLVNNWEWMGGAPNYAEFRGKKWKAFWTDRQLIEDFKKTIHYVLNRTNTITGVKYKDDPTIMAWETGNELQNPASWGIEIGRYIKSIDPKHILIDGFHAMHLENSSVWVQQYSIDEPAFDMINTHHYEGSPTKMIENLKKTVAMIGGKKPVFLGEFGFISTTGVERVVDYIISEPAIPGAFLWSLRRHHPKGGFYHHTEPVGYGIYRAYHWPGFENGHDYDETALLKMYREKAFEIQGKKAPSILPPEPPEILPFKDTPVFSWRGSTGASGYIIERARSKQGPWERIAHNVSDSQTPGFPLFNDESAIIGHSYYYRVIALNQGGQSKPSVAWGPVRVAYLTRVDKATNYGVLDDFKGLIVKQGDYRSYKEAYKRLEGESGAWVSYHAPGALKEFRLYAYEKGEKENLTFFVSDDGIHFEPLAVKVENFASQEKNYDYLVPRLYSTRTKKGQFIKAKFKDRSAIVRVEIEYGQ